MTDTDRMAVWLREAMDAAERDAEAATQGAWLPKRASNGWLIDIEGAAASQEYVVAGDGCGTPSCPGGGPIPNEADARFIAANDPAAVLRRIAADRKILEEHPHTTRVVNPGCGMQSAGFGCENCHDWDGVPEGRGNCATILALAEGWGWKDGDQ
ncbi:DUF6221 family protein [Streptomyces sp. NPDC051554]|uniref:DUF6221 family protein n=1 Tax=Streptomyces sp. NPDC051554 TaxID=3365656 RepID=UPI003790C59D